MGSQIGFTELCFFPVAFFSQIGSFSKISKISKISKTAFLEWIAFTLTRAWQGEVLGRIDDLFSSKIEKYKKKSSILPWILQAFLSLRPRQNVEHVSM